MTCIVFGGKIRSVHPDCLPPPEESNSVVVEPASPPSPPARSTRHREVPVMRKEVMGLRFSQFPDLPAALWNHLTSVYRDSLRELAGSLSEAYSAGIDGCLASLLDETIPAHVRKLGRESIKGVLGEERGFLGTRIRCHLCSEEAEYHEDVVKFRCCPTSPGGGRIFKFAAK